MGKLEDVIGRFVRDERCSKGLTYEELAEMADINRTFLYRIETGQRGISLKTFLKISGALGISPNDLLKWNENEIDTIIQSLIIGDE